MPLLPLKFYPVLVNATLLGVFIYSLMVPPSMVERLARIGSRTYRRRRSDYTRRVTQIWCVFFAINGAIALITTLWASAAVWTIYNGLIAYLLMGLLFAAEYCVCAGVSSDGIMAESVDLLRSLERAVVA